MNEIEKMYENAGIEKKIMCDWTCNCGSKFSDNCNVHCLHYEDNDLYYPPFTAEKQLELIKFLGDVRDYTVEIDKFKGVYYVGCRSAGSNDKLWGSSNTFEDALAELINETWFCLTEEEKEQIRGILNANI